MYNWNHKEYLYLLEMLDYETRFNKESEETKLRLNVEKSYGIALQPLIKYSGKFSNHYRVRTKSIRKTMNRIVNRVTRVMCEIEAKYRLKERTRQIQRDQKEEERKPIPHPTYDSTERRIINTTQLEVNKSGISKLLIFNKKGYGVGKMVISYIFKEEEASKNIDSGV